MSQNLYDVKVENGKYNIIITEDFKVKVLRGGEEWMDIDKGTKFFIALLGKIEVMEETLKYYGDPKNWEEEFDYGLDGFVSKMTFDEGKTARRVLEGDY